MSGTTRTEPPPRAARPGAVVGVAIGLLFLVVTVAQLGFGAFGAVAHEDDLGETLEAVIKARQTAVNVTVDPNAGPAAVAKAENALAGVMKQFMMLTENYPDLKANENMLKVQEELTSTENRISFARQHYNDSVRRYNTKLEQVPTNMIKNFGDFPAMEFFELEEMAEHLARKELKELVRLDEWSGLHAACRELVDDAASTYADDEADSDDEDELENDFTSEYDLEQYEKMLRGYERLSVKELIARSDGFEWLAEIETADEMRRYAAVLILKELAVNAPVLFKTAFDDFFCVSDVFLRPHIILHRVSNTFI